MTLFERIISREVPAEIVYEDEFTLAFRDIHPVAPTHVLVVPKLPIPSLAEANEAQTEILGRCLQTARKVAAMEGLESGYRVVINSGEDAGQTVFHLHLHLIGGRRLGWPPG